MPRFRTACFILIAVLCGFAFLTGCGDKSTAPATAPTIALLSPSTVQAGSGAFSLTVTGTGFASDASAQWNGSQRGTTVVSGTQLSVSISAQDVATAGSAQLTVVSGGKTSVPATFAVGTPSNPAPTITSLSPATATAGDPAFSLTVNGTGFVAGSTVQWNGAARTTTFISVSQLTAAIGTADIASAGSATLTVVSPAPGGGTSSPLNFTIASVPAPSLSSLSPATAVAGSAAFTLTVNGSGFQSGAAVAWNGSTRPTTFLSANQLTAAIPASDVVTAGTSMVDVVQGNVRSTSQLPFTIQVAAPTLSTISPNTASAGGPAFALTVAGTNFTSGAMVLWNGGARPTTVLSSTQLTAGADRGIPILLQARREQLALQLY